MTQDMRPQRGVSAGPARRPQKVAAALVRRIGLIVALSVLAVALPARANERYGAIVIEAFSGRVLLEQSADQRLHPASLTKLMTLYLAFDALRERRITLTTRMTVSAHAASMPPSELGLRAGQEISVESAILALVTKSANDAAVVLAEHLGGSEARFARMMTQKARQLGMANTTYRNANGLTHAEQLSTARDQATLARALMTDHPDRYHYFSTTSFTWGRQTHGNHNALLRDYPGADGLKTGFTRAAGFNLTASAVRDGRRVIAVMFGGETSAARNEQVARLLDYGFAAAERLRLPPATMPPPRRGVPSSAAIAAAAPSVTPPAPRPRTTQLAGADAIDPAPPPAPRRIAAAAVAQGAGAEPLTRPDSRALAALIEDLETEIEDGTAEGDVAVRAAPGPAPTRQGTQLAAAGTPRRAPSAPAVRLVEPTTLRLPEPGARTPAAPQPRGPRPGWGVQVGAFADPNATSQAIRAAITRAPGLLEGTTAMVVPVRTDGGRLVYQARLLGMSEDTARRICAALTGPCVALAPEAAGLR